MRTEIEVKVSEDNTYLIVESNVRRIDMGISWMKYCIGEWLKKSHSLIFQIVRYELRSQIYSKGIYELSIIDIQRILKQTEYEIMCVKLNEDMSRVSFRLQLKLTAEQKRKRKLQHLERW